MLEEGPLKPEWFAAEVEEELTSGFLRNYTNTRRASGKSENGKSSKGLEARMPNGKPSPRSYTQMLAVG